MDATTLERPTQVLTGDWRQRLALIVETMREMSRQTDPQAMVRAYGERIRELRPVDRRLSGGNDAVVLHGRAPSAGAERALSLPAGSNAVTV